MNSLKRIILWDYNRGTWQYDVLCLLIIAFIFLSPKTWFDRREKLATQTTRQTVKSEDFSPDQLEMRTRGLNHKIQAEHHEIRETKRENGERFYETDFR
jgi:hypothetical protein